VRTAGDQAAGLLFVQILRQLAPHLRHRALNVGSADEDRKVPHVGLVLLLEVHVQTLARDLPGGEERPRPVALALHHSQQLLDEFLLIDPHAGA
jgi:hypothetical protein